ncbi:hypothetical protein ACFLR2_00425 [Chlamydiota bacterium]
MLKRPLESSEPPPHILQVKKIALEVSARKQKDPRLKAQVDLIVSCLNRRSDSQPILQKTESLLDEIVNSSKSVEWQLAELGILCYYIGSNRSLPQNALRETLLSEIEGQMHHLKKANAGSETAYLLRQFSKMIFTNDGGFNLGGCYAVQSFLEFSLQNVLLKNVKEQVLSVVHKMAEESSLSSLFREPFELCPAWVQLIQSENATSFVDVRRALLVVLFKRKGGGFELGEHKLLEAIQEVLKTGYFSFEGEKIPAAPLYEVCCKTLENDQSPLGLLGRALDQFHTLNECVDPYETSGKKRFCILLQQEMSPLLSNINMKRLFLVEDSCVKVNIVNYQIVFDGHTSTFPFKGDFDDYRSFSHLRRLFYLSEDKLIPLDTLTALSLYCADHLEKGLDQDTLNDLQKYFTGDSFKQAAAQCVAGYNAGYFTFPPDWYSQNDALLLHAPRQETLIFKA